MVQQDIERVTNSGRALAFVLDYHQRVKMSYSLRLDFGDSFRVRGTLVKVLFQALLDMSETFFLPNYRFSIVGIRPLDVAEGLIISGRPYNYSSGLVLFPEFYVLIGVFHSPLFINLRAQISNAVVEGIIQYLSCV